MLGSCYVIEMWGTSTAIVLIVLLLPFPLFPLPVGAVEPPGYTLPLEPDEFDQREVDAYYDWRNNMFFRVFKLSDAGAKPNFMTARRTYKVSSNEFGYEVAITFAHPLFYWLDRNGDGEFQPDLDEMWIDIEEDGVNGNEKLYDPMAVDSGPRGPVPMPPVPSPRPHGEPTVYGTPGS
jgi:hypothetical protein